MDAHARARMPPPHQTPRQTRMARPGPAHLKSPPLTTSHNDNTPHDSSLSQVLSPKEGAGSIKLKIKSAITPESKSRLLIKPTGARIQPSPVPSLTNHTPSIRLVNRSLTPNDESTLVDAGWMIAAPGEADLMAGLDDYEESNADAEAVLVSVRVRPPNPVELRTDAACVWTMPDHDQHLLKLAKGTEGARDDRDWIFGKLTDM